MPTITNSFSAHRAAGRCGPTAAHWSRQPQLAQMAAPAAVGRRRDLRPSGPRSPCQVRRAV